MPMPGQQLLSLTSVGVGIDGRSILDDISFDVSAGEVLALVGPNGAGKSTLLNAITGDVELRSGSVSLFGVPIGAWDPIELAMRRAVMLQQNDMSFPFTVEQVVQMGRSPWIGSSAESDDEMIVASAMAMTESEGLSERVYTSLSGGERGRVAFARVLAQASPLLLLDEPTAAMDIKHQEMVMRLCRDYARSGCAVVVVLHALDVAAAYADRVALLESGRIRSIGRPVDVMTAESLSEVYQYPIDVFEHPGHGLVILPSRKEGDRE